jgi:hypothetical protein
MNPSAKARDAHMFKITMKSVGTLNYAELDFARDKCNYCGSVSDFRFRRIPEKELKSKRRNYCITRIGEVNLELCLAYLKLEDGDSEA